MMTLLESITGSLRRISFLFRKEVLAILKDPAIRVILIVPIVIQSLVFGYAATYDLNHVRYAVLNESHGQPRQICWLVWRAQRSLYGRRRCAIQAILLVLSTMARRCWFSTSRPTSTRN
jgi:hypothetical protein